MNLIEAFETLGFERCGDGLLEAGIEKLAVYCSSAGAWTHAARQLPSGAWTSKLGACEDIEHEHPDHLGGSDYGDVHCYMKRPRD